MDKGFDNSDMATLLIIVAFAFLFVAFLEIVETGDTSKRVKPAGCDLVYQEGTIEQSYQYDPAAVELNSVFLWNDEAENE
ncbi:MAG: hypothetical protein J6N76_08405 [Lachnospiraceae bacterium]|nr:hypothetical protein [Lachnospiraceae bacterium]